MAVVLWGARTGDIQLGSSRDRLLEELRRQERRALADLGRRMVEGFRLLNDAGLKIGASLKVMVDALAETERQELNAQIGADLEYGRG